MENSLAVSLPLTQTCLQVIMHCAREIMHCALFLFSDYGIMSIARYQPGQSRLAPALKPKEQFTRRVPTSTTGFDLTSNFRYFTS